MYVHTHITTDHASLDRSKPYTKLFLATSVIELTKFSILSLEKTIEGRNRAQNRASFHPRFLILPGGYIIIIICTALRQSYNTWPLQPSNPLSQQIIIYV